MIQLQIFCKFRGPGVLAAFLLSGQTEAATQTWDGKEKADANWTASKNWNTNVPVTGDSLIFSGEKSLDNNNNITAGTEFASITFASGGGTGSFVLGGNSINLTGNVTNINSNLLLINLPLILSATQVFNAVSGNLAVGGVISGNSLNWSAVPEPTGALVGLLIGAGMWIRRQPRVA